jgi:hypothetical protein
MLEMSGIIIVIVMLIPYNVFLGTGRCGMDSSGSG